MLQLNIISCKRFTVAGKFFTIKSTNVLTSLLNSSSILFAAETGALDSVSTIVKSFPDTCEIENSLDGVEIVVLE